MFHFQFHSHNKHFAINYSFLIITFTKGCHISNNPRRECHATIPDFHSHHLPYSWHWTDKSKFFSCGFEWFFSQLNLAIIDAWVNSGDASQWCQLFFELFYFIFASRDFSIFSLLQALNLCQVSHSFLTLNEKSFIIRIFFPKMTTNVVFTFLSSLKSLFLRPFPCLSLIIYRRRIFNKNYAIISVSSY